MSATCRSCGADIIWAETVNGKAIPLDAKPERRQVFVLSEDNLILAGREDVVNANETTVRTVPTYTPHHATCPQGEAWRKAKRSSPENRIKAALNELGVPGEGYPAPVANAVEILSGKRPAPSA